MMTTKEEIWYWEKRLAQLERRKKKTPGTGFVKIVIRKKLAELKGDA